MRNKQGITIAALIIAIIGLSVGFAAFSNTLQISSSASINPDPSSLKVVFAKDYFTEQKTTLNQLDTTAVVPTTLGTGITATNGTINNDGQNGPTLTGLSAAFTEPGQSATYNLYVVNAGQLKAYLTDIVFGTTGSPAKKVSCIVAQTKRVNNADVALTDEEKATQSLVDAACEGISVSVKVGSLAAMTSSGSLNNLELNVKGYVAVQIVISYASGSAYVDGPMNVAFGDITINASSVAAQIAQVEDLIPTAAEQEDACFSMGENQYLCVFDENYALSYSDIGGAKSVSIMGEGIGYLWVCDSASASVYSNQLNNTFESLKWYVSTNSQTYTPYEGSSPAVLNSLVNLKSQSYLTRVISTFSN